MNAHSDQINCLESDAVAANLYSGNRNGIIKVWQQDAEEDGDLKCVAQLDGNATQASVNALCKLDCRYGIAVASANTDKSIRIWQRTEPEEIGNREDNQQRSVEEPILTQGGALSQLRIHKALKKKVRSFLN
jgi:WD40 repeat protein